MGLISISLPPPQREIKYHFCTRLPLISPFAAVPFPFTALCSFSPSDQHAIFTQGSALGARSFQLSTTRSPVLSKSFNVQCCSGRQTLSFTTPYGMLETGDQVKYRKNRVIDRRHASLRYAPLISSSTSAFLSGKS